MANLQKHSRPHLSLFSTAFMVAMTRSMSQAATVKSISLAGKCHAPPAPNSSQPWIVWSTAFAPWTSGCTRERRLELGSLPPKGAPWITVVQAPCAAVANFDPWPCVLSCVGISPRIPNHHQICGFYFRTWNAMFRSFIIILTQHITSAQKSFERNKRIGPTI